MLSQSAKGRKGVSVPWSGVCWLPETVMLLGRLTVPRRSL